MRLRVNDLSEVTWLITEAAGEGETTFPICSLNLFSGWIEPPVFCLFQMCPEVFLILYTVLEQKVRRSIQAHTCCKTSGLLPHMLSEYLIRLAKLSTVIQGTSNVSSASVLLWVTVAHFPFRILSWKWHLNSPSFLSVWQFIYKNIMPKISITKKTPKEKIT